MFTKEQLKKLIIPLMVEQLLVMLVGTMDIMMVSQVGEYATSGVSLVDSITNLMVQAFAALATGGSVVAANYIGKGKHEEAGRAAVQLAVSATAIGLFLTLVCLVGREFFIDKIYGRIDADVKSSAMIYFLITCLSYPFLALYNGSAAIARAAGNSKVTMKVSILVNLINVSGNALLVLVFRMGTAGVAIPTLVSRIVGAVLMTGILMSGKLPVRMNFRHYRFDWSMIRRILQIGVPTGLDGSVFQIGKLLVASLISTLGTAAITANAVTNTLSGVINIPASALGLSLVTISGQCIGAGRKDQAIYYTRRIILLAHAVLLGMGLVIGAGSPWILKLYHLSDETYRITFRLIITYVVMSAICWPESFALPSAMRAGGDATFLMVISIGSMWVFRIAASYLFVRGFNLGVYGVWLAMYVDWIVRAVFYLVRFRSGKWVKLLK